MKINNLIVVTSLIISFNLYPMGSPISAENDSLAHNIYKINPIREEICSTHTAFTPPAELVTGQTNRLIAPLRETALNADPIKALQKATIEFAKGNKVLGNAFSDLAVTGKSSFIRFNRLYQNNILHADVVIQNLETSQFTRIELLAAANTALNRSFEVAKNILIHNETSRTKLGYIAISGEDDQPFRPVNVPAANYPQHSLKVKVNNIEVSTRYLLIESNKNYQSSLTIPEGRIIPTINPPRVSSDAKILVYVHGMGSRMEESLDMFHALKKLSQQDGRNWTMLSIDLPTNGYADQIDHTKISSISAIGTPRTFPPGFNARSRHNVPVIDFIEDFVIQAINKIDQTTPIKDKIEAVIGGSLGGNITFRLGRRTDLPWLKNIITWSPAAIWTGLADGSDIFKQIGVATAWNRAGGEIKNLSEENNDRDQFFNLVFGGAINILMYNIVPAQPDQWWRTNWSCFENARDISKIERQEVYSKNYRLWHWRLGAEQLIFSQQGVLGTEHPLYLDNKTNMLLACGEADNFNYTGICGATLTVAKKMVNTPGKAIIFANTGHSIHNERPMLFSQEITKFLD